VKFKALILDLDGTTIPNSADGMPSKKVMQAVSEAKEKISISAATGRTISYARPVLQALKLTSPCIISGGTQIVDPQTEEVLWEQVIEVEAIRQLLEIFREYPYTVSFSDEEQSYVAKNADTKKSEHIIFIMDIPQEKGDEMLRLTQKIKGIEAHVVRSYDPTEVELHVTHNLATKHHAIARLLTMLNITKEEAIGIGDSNNDIPLLQSVGFKVAIGNATKELKQMADYVAPDVLHDGVADVIRKYILHP
jgi:HAD superfamily hydrolase (TIGR01484 family)